MTLLEIAKKIPYKYRKQMLAENWIYKAIAVTGDAHMKMLFILWDNYVMPNSGEDESCGYCLARILKNFKNLEETLIQLTKEEALLEE